MSCGASEAGPIISEHVDAFVYLNDLWCRFLTLLRLTIVYIALHHMTSHYITLHHITLHRTTLHCIALH